MGNGRITCSYVKSMFDDEKELWVVDRSITGVKKLPKFCFYCTAGIPEESKVWERKKQLDFGKDKKLYQKRQIKRPCENEDCLTRFCMDRNMKKNEKDAKKFIHT